MKKIMTSLLICLLCSMQVRLVAQATMTPNYETSSLTINENFITIFPNPLKENATLSFKMQRDGYAMITTYSIDGKKILSYGENLKEGINSFLITLPKGVYLIHINGNDFSYSTKVISQTNVEIKPEIIYQATNLEGTVSTINNSNSNTQMRVSNVNNYIIGQYFQGGYIAYIFLPGDPGYVAGQTLGFIVAPIDQSSGSLWGIPKEVCTSNALGSGNTNTNKIAGYSTAASLCYDLILNGYSDWYLPSIVELTKVCNMNWSYTTNLNGYYWSSSESTYEKAYLQSMNYCNQLTDTKYNVLAKVRAVRTFGSPNLSTSDINSISSSSANCGGNITSDYGDLVTQRGVCWSTTQNPTIANYTTSNGTGIGTFLSALTELLPNTTYYVKAYAINSVGISYGSQKSFVTTAATDIDGNNYHSVNIGTQTWLIENLMTTHYRNGDIIPNITDSVIWTNLTSGAYCNYMNNPILSSTYGRLYNRFTITDSRNIAPEGWHIPSNAEWQTLYDFVNGNMDNIKEAGNTHWINSNNATNSTGFTALPGGECNTSVILNKIQLIYLPRTYSSLGEFGKWWSTDIDYLSGTEMTGNWIYYYFQIPINGLPSKYTFSEKNGYSIRCIKN